MVIWVVGIATLISMLAILAIQPQELSTLSAFVSSDQWRLACHGAVVVTFVSFLVIQFINAKFSYQSAPSVSEQNPAKRPNYPFPYTLFAVFIKGAFVLALISAVIFNALAQRIHTLETSPLKPLYVHARVTPIGVSDSLLIVNSDANDNQGSQGYRQLVRLTDIKPIDHLSQHNANSLLFNPFYNKVDVPIDGKKVGQVSEPPSLSQLNTLYSSSSLAVDNSEGAVKDIGINDPQQLPQAMTVILKSYDGHSAWLNQLSPNKSIELNLKLKPIDFKEDVTGFNEYRWLSTRHATAKASIIHTTPSDVRDISSDSIKAETVSNKELSLWQRVDQLRYQYREHFLSLIAERRQQGSETNNTSVVSESTTTINAEYAIKNNQYLIMPNRAQNEGYDDIAVTLSLLTGDRSIISSAMTQTYRFAGISHLLAISGAHVLFLAVLAATLVTQSVNFLQPRLYRILPRWQLGFMVAVVVSFVYAVFAGFDVPAVRTALMLLVIGVVRYLLAAPSVYKVLMIIAIGMAWHDVYVLWQPGFWLSFIAVTVLALYSQRWAQTESTHYGYTASSPTQKPVETSMLTTLKAIAIGYLKLQLWMSVALLPISLWLFAETSIWGIWVNIFAIGLFGWLIVPLNLLAGLLYLFWQDAADGIWYFLFWILDNFHQLLVTMRHIVGQVGWIYTPISLAVLFLLVGAILPWVLPKGVLGRLYAIPPLIVLLYLPFVDKDATDPVTRVILLQTSTHKVAATLITHTSYHWLLLSAYSNTNSYNDNNHMRDDQLITAYETIYRDLQRHGIDQLTGVVVQTATPRLAAVVANLNKDIPVSYYWQAGLDHDAAIVAEYLKDVPLTAQSCKFGLEWQLEQDTTSNWQLKTAIDVNKAGLTAMTGWPEILDRQVWDCAVEFTTHSQIAIKHNDDSQNSVELLPPTTPATQTHVINDLTSKVNHKRNHPIKDRTVNHYGNVTPTDAIANDTDSPSLKGKDSETRVIFYTSPEERLAKLSLLMCAKESGSEEFGDKFSDLDSKKLRQLKKNLHWFFSVNSYPSTDLIDTLQPNSWHFIDGTTEHIPYKMAELQLYWQQHQSSDNLE